ncbi:MAG: cytochrome c-553 [Gammaproteobacteria bacterium]|nr:cytochrome c-553 [Gammaproteobacteria bacterium]
MRLILVMFFVSGSAASMADVAAIAADCDGCHGSDGVSEWSDMPTIAGISEFVLSDAMFYYRDGDRPCAESEYRQGDTSRPATDMCKVAQALSEDDIDAISAHYAALTFKPAVQEFDAALAATGKSIHDNSCEGCHPDSGRDAAADSSVLAGQLTEYMRAQFRDYAMGERAQPAKMEARINALSTEDIEGLLNFYASLQ